MRVVVHRPAWQEGPDETLTPRHSAVDRNRGVGTVSMGFVPRDCYVRRTPDAPRLARRRLPNCEVTYGGFGATPGYFAHHHAYHAGG